MSLFDFDIDHRRCENKRTEDDIKDFAPKRLRGGEIPIAHIFGMIIKRRKKVPKK